MAIHCFDRYNARRLGEDLEAALRDVGVRHGVVVRYAGGRFTATEFTLRLVATVTEPAPGVPTAEGHWRAMAPAYGLGADWLGRTFCSGGEEFKVTGLAPRRPKYPVSAVRTRDGAH